MIPTRNRTRTTRPRLSRRFGRLAAFLAATALLSLTPVLSASADTGPNSASAGSTSATFGIQPATGDKPDSRARLTYSATPGAQITDHVAIQNFGTAALQLHVYAADAFNTSDGGFDIQAAAVTPTDTGAWVRLGGNFITVPPRSQIIVPVKILVPVNASPGDHAGGIVAGLTRITTDAKGNRVNVEERVGTRIYIRVPGKLTASLALTSVSTTYHNSWNPFGAGSATVTYTVRNTGNVRLAGAQNVRVSGFIGGARQAVKIGDIKELLPGQQITLSTSVSGVLPSFVTTGRVTIDPSALPGDLDPKASSVSATGSAASIPWPQFVLILLLGGLGFEYRRRRRTPIAPPKNAPAKSTATKSAAMKNSVSKSAATRIKAGG
ncbi:MAG TPA: hypothetical protein VFA06_10740 [Actinocrinis sp.]|uniref:hypothetical protein n=1 Tax=Actinocrinis sp. TaxID=1920516 RepID=UPI002D36AB70|nr:hypothetical protein [Actinocrinis sp.]HZU56335.1 hypothetical protein [Actinocrinis sp.]